MELGSVWGTSVTVPVTISTSFTCCTCALFPAHVHVRAFMKICPAISEKSCRQDLGKKKIIIIITSANCNGNRYRCSPNAPQLPFGAIFSVSFIK